MCLKIVIAKTDLPLLGSKEASNERILQMSTVEEFRSSAISSWAIFSAFPLYNAPLHWNQLHHEVQRKKVSHAMTTL
eukprot:TRINITY_DN3353_c0_g1_i1.p1 TRINITY_DN3353_c0_g1~~TRINITY_DN3353_c0_g1_i1.p1  ORF type:complete len:77 (+),score=2.48 TRINITY_DN3353_c0_g1_i1:61-291(+)